MLRTFEDDDQMNEVMMVKNFKLEIGIEFVWSAWRSRRTTTKGEGE